MGRNRPALRDRIAVFLAQLPADIRVQGKVERPDLLPEAVELSGKLIGRHVVLGSPHDSGIGETELSRALVGERDETGEVLSHRRRDPMPALPDVEKLLGVAARREDLGDLLQIQAVLPPRRTVLALAVDAFEAGGDAGDPRALLGIRGRRGGGTGLLNAQSACGVFGEVCSLQTPRALLVVAPARPQAHTALMGS